MFYVQSFSELSRNPDTYHKAPTVEDAITLAKNLSYSKNECNFLVAVMSTGFDMVALIFVGQVFKPAAPAQSLDVADS